MTRRCPIAVIVVVALAALATGFWRATRGGDENETFEPVAEYQLDPFIDVNPWVVGIAVGMVLLAAALNWRLRRRRRRDAGRTGRTGSSSGSD